MAILKDKSKKKKGENIIGKIIYGFLLFAPLLNILVSCMYVTFNKNAYKSYDDITTLTINSLNDFKLDQEYYFVPLADDIYGSIGENNSRIYAYDFKYQNTVYDDVSFWFYGSPTTPIRVYARDNLTNTNIISDGRIYQLSFSFKYVRNTFSNETIFDLVKSLFEYHKIGTLDNAFIYGTEKTENSDLFNWAKDTGSYTIMQNVTTGIGITNTFIPMLMTYWLLISIIYFIFDIALILIWAVHDKIHELKDAI